jgi:hypothetical protein
MTTERFLSFGALVDPIEKQVPELPKDAAKIFQKDMESIIRLYIHGILSDSERERAYTRLAKKIREAVKKIGKEKK